MEVRFRRKKRGKIGLPFTCWLSFFSLLWIHEASLSWNVSAGDYQCAWCFYKVHNAHMTLQGLQSPSWRATKALNGRLKWHNEFRCLSQIIRLEKVVHLSAFGVVLKYFFLLWELKVLSYYIFLWLSGFNLTTTHSYSDGWVKAPILKRLDSLLLLLSCSLCSSNLPISNVIR